LQPDRDLQAESRGDLRTDAKEVAKILKIEPLVAKLRLEKNKELGRTVELSKSCQQARLLCLWKIMAAKQEVRQSVALIDQELSKSNRALESLTNERDMAINTLNTVNFLQAGTLGTIRQASVLHGLSNSASQEIAISSFGTGTALAVTNLLLPSVFKRQIEQPPALLLSYFDANYLPPDSKQSYLWQFLNSPKPGDGLKRRELLVRHWHDFAGLSLKDPFSLSKFSSSLSSKESISEGISLLRDRITILHDLKTHIEEFESCLFELHAAITFIQAI
jgi:hypothetical protein